MTNTNLIRESATKKAILARLRLAQKLLEESDVLLGHSGYIREDDGLQLRHPRHEREAIVNYLLLTCFDKLGQKGNYSTFENWLNSTKKTHVTEKQRALNALTSTQAPIESAIALAKEYNKIYGVKNAFVNGIKGLPEGIKTKFLNSISVVFVPNYQPNTSARGQSLDNKEDELNRKLKFIFAKRNRFTHNLEQHEGTSTPMMSDRTTNGGASWFAQIRDSKLKYFGTISEYELTRTGGAYVYSLSEWPFIVFETLYSAIGIKFHRTEIDIKFQVDVWPNTPSGKVFTFDNVKHKELLNYQQFIDYSESQ